MKGTITSSMGEIQITPDAVAIYAATTAVECFGIVGMAKVGKSSDFARLLRKESQQKGIEVRIEDNEISLDFHVIVAYGVSIRAVADNLIENVRYKVEESTGMKVKCVNVFVEGVRVID